MTPESHSTRWHHGRMRNKKSGSRKYHPNAKNSGLKREKGKKRYLHAEKNDYDRLNVIRNSNYIASAC